MIRTGRGWGWVILAGVVSARLAAGAPYLDNETLYANQDPETETRRSDHFRLCFGHYDRDGGMSEQMAQGNLQMYEQMWNRWVNELGLHDINESVTSPDGNKYRANFNFLMTWNDGGGGGAYSSMDGGGFFYAMANPGYCRFDPPSGATPHEFGHVWEGSSGGFNGTDSSGAWWESVANWIQLQFLNSYPQAGGYLYNGVYYPAHGRDYYDSWVIFETARDDPRYGVAWVNNLWTNWNADQQAHEFILDRMIRIDSSGSADKAGAMKDLWGDMTKKMVTWDFARKQWLAQANSADDGSDWNFYQRCRTPLVKMPGTNGWYRPGRGHLPMEFGFNFVPLSASTGATVACTFQPLCDPVRQSDWRAGLVAVSSNGDARYSTLWNKGTQTMKLSADETRLYLVVVATPKPMKITDPVWAACRSDAGLQFPYAVSFSNAAPRHVTYPIPAVTFTRHPNGGGRIQSGATVASTAYVGTNAMVLGAARVEGYARIEDYAVVRENAQVRDYAVVSGHAVVEDYAQVYGYAKVRDWGHVFGYAEVYEHAKVLEHGNCGDGSLATHTRAYGHAVIKGTTYVYDPSTLAGSLIMDGDSANGNGTGAAADHGVHFGWAWGQDANRFSGLADNAYRYEQHTFEKSNAVFALDQYGINHGLLMNGCRVAKDTAAPARGGLVLPLDGASQYVELHNSANDFRDTAIAVWAKWTGTNDGQRIWSLGDGAAKVMYLTPRDGLTGKLRFVITDGAATQQLDGASAMPTGVWTHVAVVLTGTTHTLYVDGEPVATNAAATLLPDSLHAPLMENANYLGRGNAGGFFHGYLDDFRVYMKALSAAEIAAVYAEAEPAPVTVVADTNAPTPNAATWLVPPQAIGDNAVTMSATPGTDASGWVEYYFQCASGGGHDSGWVSFNKYTDVGLSPGTSCTYTVRMRDRDGNTTAASSAAGAALPVSAAGTAAFAYGPVGIATGRITMTAAVATNASGQVEYKFDRTAPTAASSGWQASPTWTQAGLATNGTYTYTVTVRDGRGNTSSASAPASALARDGAAPRLPMTEAHWEMQPYATIDNRISMTAQPATDPSGVQYFFRCVSGGGPDSAWQTSATFLTPVLPDGTYVYTYKVRDQSAQTNESPYAVSYPATITPTSGYHGYAFPQLSSLPDDYLATFTGVVTRVVTNHYIVRDPAGTTTLVVRTSAFGEATQATNIFKLAQVKGHLYTRAGSRLVTYAAVTAISNASSRTISGQVRSTTGTPITGAVVYISDVANPSTNPVATATTDASGNYSRPVVDGPWYVAAGAAAYNISTDRVVVISGASASNISFSLVSNARISGVVTRRSDGAAVAGARVYFSRSPGASAAPAFTAVTAADGSYTQGVQDGVWYVCAGGTNFYTSADKSVTVAGGDVPGIDFALKSNARSVPRTNDLWFAVVTDSLPAGGPITNWPTYLPAGQTLTNIGSPTAESLDGATWERNIYADGDGFTQGRYASSVACSGVTIIAAVRPQYAAVGGEARGEVVDVFYDRLALAVSHTDGRVMVARNYWNDWGPAIPNGQKRILSLVVQPDGSYRAFTNGVQIMTGAANGDWTSINPDHSATWGNDPDFTHYVTVGRNSPDGWSTYNGHIGDVFVYKGALSDAERAQVEADLTAKFLATDPTIVATAGVGGIINPGGTVPVNPGGSQTFQITPAAGFAVMDVIVDGTSRGALSSYTFTNVTAGHTISAVFGSGESVVLTAPGAGATFVAPAMIDLAASATTNQHALTKVQFLSGPTLLGEDTAAPYTWTWSNVAAGAYTLSARAFYTGGGTQDSASVDITASNPPPPTVTLVSPTTNEVWIPSGVGLILEAGASTVRSPASLLVGWGQSSGPGVVAFGNGGATNATALFPTGGTYVLTFSADDGTLQSSANVTVHYGAVHNPWVGGAVGTATGTGHSASGGVFTLAAGGAGITSTGPSDHFYFLRLAATGNVAVTARVVSVQNISASGSRAGVMIREAAVTNARHVFMGVSRAASNPGRFVYRLEPGSNSASSSSAAALPYWVRVARSGNVFTAHSAPDSSGAPGTWTARGTRTNVMGSAVLVGLAATSGSTTNGQVVIDHVTVSFAAPNVGPLVGAGLDLTSAVASLALPGAASDDGRPETPGTMTTRWSQVSGPDVVSFANAGSTNASATFPALGTYVLRLTADDGEVKTFDDVSVTIVSPVPPTPLAPFAAGGDGLVSLTWSPSAGATGYRVQRSTVSGGVYTVIGSVASTNCSDNAVSNGVTYYYVISATNSAGASSNSTQVSAMPRPAAPATPQFLASGVAPDFAAGILRFTFGTTAGYQYRLTYTEDLTPTSPPAVWLPVIDPPNHPAPNGWSATSLGAPMTVTNYAIAGASNRFFRIEGR